MEQHDRQRDKELKTLYSAGAPTQVDAYRQQDTGEGPSMPRDTRAEAGPSNQTNHEKGSWTAVLGSGLWDHTKAFWDNGQQDWSSEIATKKVINETNRYEFQEMQNLKIPGHYLQHRDEDKKIDKYAYIPINIPKVWEKVFRDQEEINVEYMKREITKDQTYKGWFRDKLIQYPDVQVRTPGGGIHTIDRSEGGIQEYYDKNFKDREGDNGISTSAFRKIITSLEQPSLKGYTRITDLPKKDVKQRVQTPIIWEVAPDQGSSSRT